MVEVDAGIDYRLRVLEQVAATTRRSARPPTRRWPRRSSGCAGAGRGSALAIEGRTLVARRRAGSAVWFDFATLCDGPRSQRDYLELARSFSVLLLSGVPRMTAAMGDRARRFTWLVDILYDHRVKLLVAAAAAPTGSTSKGRTARSSRAPRAGSSRCRPTITWRCRTSPPTRPPETTSPPVPFRFPLSPLPLKETPVHKFKAYRTFEDNKVVMSRFVDMTLDELDPGDVVVKTKYSTINYKDALSYNGTGKIMRKYPTNAGIDMAGTVESSTDPRWKRGDKVIVHAYDMGVAHDGGYAEYVRVPGDWVVRRPESMTAFDAMTLGTAGFTAAQAIMLMEHNGLKPGNGPVAVTGATGGVGSVAVEILAKTGYHVVAITGKEEETHYLKGLGAKEVLLRQSIDLSKIRPLEKATWAGAVDNLGGDILSWLLATTKIGGAVGAVGLAADMKLNTTVAPFILRGVSLLGADSANCPMSLRQKIWNKLAVDWRPDKVHDQVRTIDFDELPDALRRVHQGPGPRPHRGQDRPDSHP